MGKSSTIRALTGHRVRVGKKPGSTRWEIMIDLGSVSVVDIPGFGYMAGTSKTEIEEMKTMLVHKLEEWSKDILVAVLIIDISLFRELVERWNSRNEIPIDIEFYTFLNEITPQVLVVANKIDKVKKFRIQDEIDYLAMKLGEAIPGKDPHIIGVSASKRRGLDQLKMAISSAIPDIEIW